MSPSASLIVAIFIQVDPERRVRGQYFFEEDAPLPGIRHDAPGYGLFEPERSLATVVLYMK